MRKHHEDISERSLLHLFELEENVKPPRFDWEHDAKLLNLLANLTEMRPHYILRKITWATGENIDSASFHEGRPLSVTSRAQLHAMLMKRLRVEEEIIKNCCQASAQVTKLAAFFMGLTVIALLFFR